MKKYIKLCLLIIWLGIIFFLSNQKGTTSLNESNGLLEFIATMFCISDVNNFVTRYEAFIRELAHFGEYFILGLLVYINLNEYTNKKISTISFILCLIYAISDEVHQLFVDDRAFTFIDIVIDAFGAIVGIFLTHQINKYVAKRKSTKLRDTKFN